MRVVNHLEPCLLLVAKGCFQSIAKTGGLEGESGAVDSIRWKMKELRKRRTDVAAQD